MANFEKRNTNADPITGEPGAHPIGTGLGAAGGASAGAVIGTAAGPIGTVAGAVVGAIVGGIGGGLAGKEIAEAINPTDEEAYWRSEYPNRPYADANTPFETYKPAYRYGYDARIQNPEREFNDVEPQLSQQWQSSPNNSSLGWDKARDAVRDSYDRTGTVYKTKLKERKAS